MVDEARRGAHVHAVDVVDWRLVLRVEPHLLPVSIARDLVLAGFHLFLVPADLVRVLLLEVLLGDRVLLTEFIEAEQVIVLVLPARGATPIRLGIGDDFAAVRVDKLSLLESLGAAQA